MLHLKNIEELKTSTGKTYLKLKVDLASKWVYSDWIGYPTPENVAKGAIAYLDLMRECNMHSVLNDNRNLVGSWIKSLEWIEKEWLPYAVKSQMKYFAHIVPSDALSVDAAAFMQNFVKEHIFMEIFHDLESAKAWLRSVNN